MPEGSSGIDLTPQDFVATAGEQNLSSLARYSSILPKTERLNAAVFGEFDLTPNVSAFAEGMYVDRSTERRSSPVTLSNARVPATNAFNPFGVDVNASFMLEGLGPRVGFVESELTRAVAGLRGGLGKWDWEISAVSTREKAENRSENNTDAARVAAALASSDPAQALNVFQDGPGGSAELLASLVAAPNINTYTSKGVQYGAFARGPLFELPAGPVEVAVGGEFREEDIRYNDFVLLEADRDVKAAFVEASVPIVGEEHALPLMRRLTLRLAARIDEYSDFGRSENPQYGLVWMPARNLTLRASYGTSFRPPSLYELYAPRTVVPFSERDPQRDNELFQAEALTGGNPDLKPVEGDSFVAGAVWTAPEHGVRLELSWWEVNLSERVAVLPIQRVLQNEEILPGRVVRSAPSPDDVAAGWPGPIEQINISRGNFGRLETNGVDLSASYAFSTGFGQWQSSLSATWVNEYWAADAPGSALVNRVGIASSFGTIPEWRAVASLGWAHRAWSASVTGRFVDGYDDVIGTATVGTGRRVPSQTLFDLNVGWRADRSGLVDSPIWQGVSVTAGLINAFDKAPPFATVSGTLGFDTSQGDLRQRFGYVNISKRF